MTRLEYFDLIGEYPEDQLGPDWANTIESYTSDDFSCPANNCGNPKSPDEATCGEIH